MDCIKLDEQFKHGLIIINPFIYGLNKKNYVRLCRMWIDKLIHCAPNERQLRNIYLEQLCRHSQQQVLGPPFNCPPNEGPLQMIPQQFLIKQGVVLDRPVTSTVTSQTEGEGEGEGETVSWSDVSVTSCLTSSSYQQDQSVDGQQPVRKVVSTTSTAVSKNTTHHIRFKRHNKSQSLIRTKNHRKLKKQTCDSNDELFKDCYETPVSRKGKKQTPRGEICRSFEYCKETKGGNLIKKKQTKSKCLKETFAIQSKIQKESKETKENLQNCKTTPVLIAALDKEKLIDKERVLDKEKIIELKKQISEIQKANGVLNEQLQQERRQKEELNISQETLKKEVLEWKDKLTLIVKVKNALEGEHKEFVDNITDTLSTLSASVNNAVSKNDHLENLLITMNSDIKESESANAEALQLSRREKQELNKQILELKKSHSEIILSYKNNISDLKKDLSKKNKEIDRLEKQLQEQCSRMKTEVENIKQEIENSKELKMKNAAYKSKIVRLTSKIVKLVEHNKKMADCYEQKINVLNKSKDMELWVQKLSIGSSLTNGKKQELENIVSALEEKFRKQLKNATQITFHNMDPTVKCFEATQQENREILRWQRGRVSDMGPEYYNPWKYQHLSNTSRTKAYTQYTEMVSGSSFDDSLQSPEPSIQEVKDKSCGKKNKKKVVLT